MYRLIDNAETRCYREECNQILNKTCAILKTKGIDAKFYLVGSGAKNLITRNGKGPYDLDYNLEITDMDESYGTLQNLKETVRFALNRAKKGSNFKDAHDSTSVLTALLHIDNEPQVKFSFDVAIVRKNRNGDLCRLIHNKNAWGIGNDQYTWNEIPNSKDVSIRATAIKNASQWQEVRNRYVEKKNEYLRTGDKNHPSYIVYVEAVNEIYNEIIRNRQNLPTNSALMYVSGYQLW